MNKLVLSVASRVIAPATLTLGLLGGAIQSAQAALMVDVLGIPGSGFTTWIFSGTATATAAGEFVSTNIADTDSTQWKEIGDYVITDIDNVIFTDPASTASVTTSTGGTQAITGVLIDRDSSVPGTNNDDWTIAPLGNLLIGNGDTVTWSGALTLNVDINNFFLGSFNGSEEAPGNLFDTQLTFTQSTFAVPEPLTLLGAGAAIGLGAAFKKKKANSKQ